MTTRGADAGERRTVPLGEIEPTGSRNNWRRSSVHVHRDRADRDQSVIVGRWDGTVTVYDADSLEKRWECTHPESAVALATLEHGAGDGETDLLIVGGRGANGTLGAYDASTGEPEWTLEASADVGSATSDRLFSQPYVVALESGPETCYAAVRRYERDGGERRWQSAVYALEADGTVRWRYETDASPIGLSLSRSQSPDGRADAGDRLAVAYNRCSGEHDHGVVVLETDAGTPSWTWDPGTQGDRRVGDVAFLDAERLAVASHGGKRGYLLGSGGRELWRVDLATEIRRGEETLYAYPNHVAAANGVVVFVTGNTYALEFRETEHRHPNEHGAFAFDGAGDARWSASVEGFVREFVAVEGGDGADGASEHGAEFVAACAQNFRVRDPRTHGIRRFDRSSGDERLESVDGIVTAVAADDDLLAAVEEPVEYHDEGVTRGEYAVHVFSST